MMLRFSRTRPSAMLSFAARSTKHMLRYNTHMSFSNSSIKPKLVADILESKTPRLFTIPETSTMLEAIDHFVTQQLAALLALSPEGEVSGVLTARDVLRVLHKFKYAAAFDVKVADVMTKKEKMVFCSPKDPVSKVLETMYQVKIRNIPVLDNGEVSGIVTLKDLADSAFDLMHVGGKKGFMSLVAGRKGIPMGTRLARDIADAALEKSGRYMPDLGIQVASFAMPHPYKRPGTVANSRRDYGADALCTDTSLCEDAHFAVHNNDSTHGGDGHVYMCVADGVGSWRGRGVDPRAFSHYLVDQAKLIVSSRDDALTDPIHPLDVIMEAWENTVQAKVVGSSTVCLATLDRKLNQLSYSNIGDCGLLVVRHIDSEKAGYMRNRQQPRHLRTSDIKIAYLSQQQLRSFNLPYQLGFAQGVPGFTGRFESPADADTASIPVMPGDVIILGTDGVFDNLDLDEIVYEVSVWEKKYFPGSGRSQPDRALDDIRLPCARGAAAMEELAKLIVHKAREFSLDSSRDSPFALLAKENDIMWSGGMPDDTSVVVARVFERDS